MTADSAKRPDRGRYSLAQLLMTLPWVALVIDAGTSIGDNSFLWHVRSGALQQASGEVLVTDPFSFTVRGETWLTQSWLAELLYARLEQSTGLEFVPWMLLGFTSLTFAGIGLLSYFANRNTMATAIVLILATVSFLGFLVPRPVLFSYLLFVISILAWERPATRWLLPFIFWIWASVHGSFFIGLGYIGLRLIAKREWRQWWLVASAGVAVMFTAHGLGILQVLLDFVAARPYLGLLTEWRPPELLSPVFFPLFIGLALILIGAARGFVPTAQLWVVIPFLALSLTATRSVPPALIALLMPISMSIGVVGSQLPRRFGRPAALVFIVFVLIFPFVVAGEGELNDERFPVVAAEALADGNVFHDDVVGGYLIWRDGPGREVYIDDRAELYKDRMQTFIDIRNGRTPWEPEFEEFAIEQALLRTNEPLVDWLSESGWESRYEDDEFVLLVAP